MTPTQPDLSIIIPAYNEMHRIGGTLVTIHHYIEHNHLSAEIIVVDDGSTDDTLEVVHDTQEIIPNIRVVEIEHNRGKGYAIRRGVEVSIGHQVLFTDADHSTPIQEYAILLDKMKTSNSHVVIGSRYIPGSTIKIRQSLPRVLISRFGNYLIRMTLLKGYRDTQCGFKLFETQAAKDIFSLQRIHRFGFDMEALLIANSLGYKVAEVPVQWRDIDGSRFHTLRDAFVTLKELCGIKFNQWRGYYRRKRSHPHV